MNADDMLEIITVIDEIYEEIFELLTGYGMTESTERIAFNISLGYSCSVKALSISDKKVFVDLIKLREFVLKDVVKFSATWQTLTGIKRKYAQPTTPLSSNKKRAAVGATPSVTDYLLEAIKSLTADELKQVMRILILNNPVEEDPSSEQPSSAFLAYEDTAIKIYLTSKKVGTAFLVDLKALLLGLPGFVASWNVKFAGKKTAVMAMLIPISAVSDEVLQALEKADAVTDTGAEATDDLAEQSDDGGDELKSAGSIEQSASDNTAEAKACALLIAALPSDRSKTSRPSTPTAPTIEPLSQQRSRCSSLKPSEGAEDGESEDSVEGFVIRQNSDQRRLVDKPEKTVEYNATSETDSPIEGSDSSRPSTSQENAKGPMIVQRSRFDSPKPRGALVAVVGGKTSAIKAGDMSLDDSDGTAPSTVQRFHSAVAPEALSSTRVKDCAKCGKHFSVTQQKLKCRACGEFYHRNCAKVQSNHFQGDRAEFFHCKECKAANRNPKKKQGGAPPSSQPEAPTLDD